MTEVSHTYSKPYFIICHMVVSYENSTNNNLSTTGTTILLRCNMLWAIFTVYFLIFPYIILNVIHTYVIFAHMPKIETLVSKW